MKSKPKNVKKRRGSALILVVVVTVLLAVIGVMFLMVSRVSEMETVTIADSRDLNGAVETVVTRIHEVLATDYEDPTDYTLPWLAALVPEWVSHNGTPANYDDDTIRWPHVTDLWDQFPMALRNLVINNGSGSSDGWMPNNPMENGLYDRADADGDGVADSRWVKIPGITSSRGKDIFAAIRIIDNGAMLNLNTAYCFFPGNYNGESLFERPWYADKQDHPGYPGPTKPYHDNQTGSGHYLTDTNYLPFLRGRDQNGNYFDGSDKGDDWYNLMLARNLMYDPGDLVPDEPFTPQQCQAVLMNIEDPGDAYQFFGIGDELEIRNRYLLTSPVEAWFEQKAVVNFSLDSGGGVYKALEIPRQDKLEEGLPHIDRWYWRVDPANFDLWSGSAGYDYVYDRRHVCTFYSYDRDFQTGSYPLLNNDLGGLGLSAEQREKAERVFRPVGMVTADFYALEQAGTLWTANNTETRRRILHLLYAFREYFYDRNGNNLSAAAKSAAQVVANMIDYTDDDAINPTSVNRQGPFYDAIYGTQANVDCTFITEDIIQNMIDEVSEGLISPDIIPFGLGSDVVFGYEKQPFISEVYAYRNPDNGNLEGFAVELVNPYTEDIKLYRADTAYNANEDVWRIRAGDGLVIDYIVGDIARFVPQYDTTNKSPGRYIVRHPSVPLASGPLASLSYTLTGLIQIQGLANKEIQLLRPAPKWVKDNLGISFIVVDAVTDAEVSNLLMLQNRSALKREDTKWKFIYADYTLQQEDLGNYTHTLGQANGVTVPGLGDGFQIGVANDGRPGNRWHDLEVLSLFGNGADPNDTAMTITTQLRIAASGGEMLHFDFTSAVNSPSAYIAPVARPDYGSVPGRININTAPAVVMAAAIPPTLADPNAATSDPVGFSALDAAQAIAANRPYQTLDDLLTVGWVQQYASGGAREDENVGCQSIRGDIEEEHWVLSNLANKFTVRSDVFTAYILVRLGTDGPQRRMLAIFDRSNVWDENDRPELVALHPVPDPR